MKRPNIKLLILAAAIILLVGIVYTTKKKALTVTVATYEENVPIEVFGLGTVEARVRGTIGFKPSNTLVEMYADEGDFVRKGTPLARLDTTEQQARLAKAQASVLSAKAAQGEASASIAKARSMLAQKKRTNARQKTLLKTHSISAEAAETTQMEQETALTDLHMAQNAYLSAKAALETALAQVELEQIALEQHVLKAPFDAVIVKRHLEPGIVVKSLEPVFTLVDPSSIWILAHISEDRSGEIARGQKAHIRLRSRPHDLYTGTVQRIDIENDRVTEEKKVYTVCDNCPKEFDLGEQAEVYITTTILKKALLVPESAVQNFDERHMKGTVWIVQQGSLNRQPVTFDHRTLDARLSIASGLPENCYVLTQLPKGIKEGRAAKIAQEE